MERSRLKLILGAIIYAAMFIAHLVPIYVFRNSQAYGQWLSALHAFGGSPLPSTDTLLATLRYWWIYPLIGIAVFGYFYLYRQMTVVPVIFMTIVAGFFWWYLYMPVIVLGPIIYIQSAQ
jgi:hypothetical protein